MEEDDRKYLWLCPLGGLSSPPKGASEGRPWVEVAKNSASFVNFLNFKGKQRWENKILE